MSSRDDVDLKGVTSCMCVCALVRSDRESEHISEKKDLTAKLYSLISSSLHNRADVENRERKETMNTTTIASTTVAIIQEALNQTINQLEPAAAEPPVRQTIQYAYDMPKRLGPKKKSTLDIM